MTLSINASLTVQGERESISEKIILSSRISILLISVRRLEGND